MASASLGILGVQVFLFHQVLDIMGRLGAILQDIERNRRLRAAADLSRAGGDLATHARRLYGITWAMHGLVLEDVRDADLRLRLWQDYEAIRKAADQRVRAAVQHIYSHVLNDHRADRLAHHDKRVYFPPEDDLRFFVDEGTINRILLGVQQAVAQTLFATGRIPLGKWFEITLEITSARAGTGSQVARTTPGRGLQPTGRPGAAGCSSCGRRPVSQCAAHATIERWSACVSPPLASTTTGATGAGEGTSGGHPGALAAVAGDQDDASLPLGRSGRWQETRHAATSMRTRSTLAVVVSASLCIAQSGTDLVFVGASMAGGSDPFFFANQNSATPLASGGNANSNEVTDAVWDEVGNLYVAQANPPQISRAQWNGGAIAWSTFYAAPGPCHGLGYDRHRQRLWVLTGPTSTTRQLVCLGADPASPAYGTVIATTSTLAGPVRERWELSPTGWLAAVPQTSAQGLLLDLVDTNPASPTFLQVTASVPVPGTSSATTAVACAFSPYHEWAYLLYAGPGTQGLAVLLVGAQQWLDFDPVTPGQQDFAIPLPLPNRIAVPWTNPLNMPVVVSGHGGSGWAARVAIDYSRPGNTTFTPFTAPLGLPNCSGASLSSDDARLAVTATPVASSGPSYLALFDVRSGALLQYIPLPGAWNVTTTAWQDTRPAASFTPFGAGCPNVTGPPLLRAWGSRPLVGTIFTLRVDNAAGLTFLCLGFSATSYGPYPLPLPLASFGMPGCTLYAAPETVLAQAGNVAQFLVLIPPLGLLHGTVFYAQAVVYDVSGSMPAWSASNAGRAVVGWWR